MSDDKIKIKGGAYRWRNDGDGYFTVLDVPLVSEWAKGDHDAPYPGSEETLKEFVATAQRRYKEGQFCATAYKRHNPDIPFDHPDFLGYVLPNRVGKYKLESGEKWTAFGDVKLSQQGFEEAKTGKLPYLSVEIPWARRRIRGLSFQDTLPPAYEYALFTIGEEAKDETGKFQVSKESVSKFMDDAACEPDEKPEDGNGDEEFGKRVGSYLDKHIGKYIDKHMKTRKFEQATDPLPKKPTGLPSEPGMPEGGAKMTDPEVAAKFTALSADNAELKARLDKRDQEQVAAKFVAKAEAALSQKILTPALREQIAGFAGEWSGAKDGEAKMDKYIEALKPSLKEKPTSLVGSMTASGQAVDTSDPAVAKFAAEGPDAMERAGKLAAQWRELKRKLGDRIASTEEAFIALNMGMERARQNGLFIENGR